MFIKIVKVISLSVFFALCVNVIKAQDARVKSADNEFIMEIYRESKDIRLVFYFTDVTKYSYLVVEREESHGQFRQCAYIDLKAQDSYGGAIEVKDNYPQSPLEDSHYRIRTVTNDRIERIYPPVKLAAKSSDECHDGQ